MNILVHGNSEGFNSEFMQYIANRLKELGKEVYGFDFEYIRNGSEPSKWLAKELDQLKKIIEDFKSKGYDKINLIGKSLGGTICLNELIANDEHVNKIVIVGFPYILGFPADLSLLEIKPVVAKPEAEQMYIEAFGKLGQNASKISIIQGKDDLLGSADILNSLLLKLSIKPKISYVENSSHGFKPINETTTLDQNMQKIMEIIKSNI